MPEMPQPTRSKRVVDFERVYDKTSLTSQGNKGRVNRDYLAHCFRWGFLTNFINRSTDILDVGCGVDCAVVGILNRDKNSFPNRYVGVDVNRESHQVIRASWATYHWETDFVSIAGSLGQFDVVACFEMLEHVQREYGVRVLQGISRCCKSDGVVLLSTPVFNGKAAANHIHEWTIDELQGVLEEVGLYVLARYGTFASLPDLRKVAARGHLHVLDQLSLYYSPEVLACFLAPLYPDASRNNLWVLQRA